MSDTDPSVHLSLISHTNAGKTTLARTLLGRDVGEVRDAAHVTDVAQDYPMLVTAGGSKLILWDTPGFGDTARLLRRLKLSGHPLAWGLTQAWDRYLDRPLWCSQQAMRNARDNADVILYLVNAAEDPEQTAYVEMEMQILGWIGKPVLLLLNQMGPPSEAAEDLREEQAWRAHLQRFTFVRGVLPMDAFARCWVQEGVLLGLVESLLPPAKQSAYADLMREWRGKQLACFDDAMELLSRQLARALCDREDLDPQSWGEKLRGAVSGIGNLGRNGASAQEHAMQALAQRADAEIGTVTQALIERLGLKGHAADEVMRRLHEDYAASIPVSERGAAIFGGLLSGALGGLAADIVTGGLSFGGGMVIGGISGALGAGGVAHGYNLVKGKTPSVRWSAEFFEGMFRSALLRYLAVAHFGRGRGDYAEGEHPAFWRQAVDQLLFAKSKELRKLWEQARDCKDCEDGGEMARQIKVLLSDGMKALLIEFYPIGGEVFTAR